MRRGSSACAEHEAPALHLQDDAIRRDVFDDRALARRVTDVVAAHVDVHEARRRLGTVSGHVDADGTGGAACSGSAAPGGGAPEALAADAGLAAAGRAPPGWLTPPSASER